MWQKTTKSAVCGRSTKAGALLRDTGATVVSNGGGGPGKRALASAEMMRQVSLEWRLCGQPNAGNALFALDYSGVGCMPTVVHSLHQEIAGVYASTYWRAVLPSSQLCMCLFVPDSHHDCEREAAGEREHG